MFDMSSRFVTPARAFAAFLLVLSVFPAIGAPRHGISMHGMPSLPEGFESFPHARVDAPKGGRIVFGVQGTFDTLNPFVIRGIAAQGIAPPNGYVVQSLMTRSADEPFSLYSGIAATIETPEDRSWVVFRIDPRARFSDGKPVTSADVLFSWSLLKEKGKPTWRAYYAKVKAADAADATTVRFDLSGAGDRELPLILALMPVLPRHAVDPARFEETSLAAPLGSGPYKVAEIKAGESVLLRRDPDFWGKDLPSFRGLYNADEIRFDYYRDANSLFEAFKGGLYDVRIEDNPSRWTSGYDFPAMKDGRAVRDSIPIGLPKGMSGFVFNTRRPIFADVRVREALGLVFDFEWVNRTLFHGLYRRTSSFFEGSDLASTGRPASARERDILGRYPGVVREDVLSGDRRSPSADGSGRDREAARTALGLLKAAGWTLVDGTLRNAGSEPFVFEFLVVNRLQERLALNYARSLERLGIRMEVRLIDDVQFWRRLTAFDFDMIQFTWAASASPGNEQYNRWSARAADRQGSLNYAGARSPAIEAAIDAMLAAREREEFVDAVRALDRVLLSGSYVVPLFHAPDIWLARKTEVRRPARVPLFGYAPETFWVERR
jgi:peptide/nickel transport system substrate-binding protein